MVDRTRPARMAELAGAPPQLASAADLESAGALTGRTHARQVMSKKPGRINLKAVAEACIDAGLDPAVEILRALQEKVIVMDRSGAPVLDEQGNPVMVDRVDPDTRLRTLNELLQYTQPKLKAVEVKMSGSLELTNDQLDQRLAALISKAAR
jgi:hypothetical protein